VKADIGIVIGEDQSLLNTLEEFGYTPQENTSTKAASSLYRVDTWDQIKTILDKHF
jgi:hypothetical protein